MSPRSYYLINHTHKEFCYVEHDMPIFHVLDEIMMKFDHWTKSDDIVIDSQDACSSELVEYLVNDLGYMDIDYGDMEWRVGNTMSLRSYYLINRTHKEFCYVEHDMPIFHVLDEIMMKFDRWMKSDNIVIDSQDACSSELVEYLVNDLGYIDMDYDEDEEDE